MSFHPESNWDLRFRRPSFYPLNYRKKKGSKLTSHGLRKRRLYVDCITACGFTLCCVAPYGTSRSPTPFSGLREYSTPDYSTVPFTSTALRIAPLILSGSYFHCGSETGFEPVLRLPESISNWLLYDFHSRSLLFYVSYPLDDSDHI